MIVIHFRNLCMYASYIPVHLSAQACTIIHHKEEAVQSAHSGGSVHATGWDILLHDQVSSAARSLAVHRRTQQNRALNVGAIFIIMGSHTRFTRAIGSGALTRLA